MNPYQLPIISNKRIRLLFLFAVLFSCVSLCFNSNVSAQVLTIQDFTVFGGAQTCSPLQLPPVPSGPIRCRVHIGAGSTVYGNVGSWHYVEANGGVTVNGNIHSGGEVNLANGNTVGRVTAANGDNQTGIIFRTGSGANILGAIDVVGDINVNVNGSSVAGTVTHPVGTTYVGPVPGGGEVLGAPPLPTLPLLPTPTVFTCPTGSAAPTISTTQTITPGSYTDVISTNAPLTLTFDGPGNYYFNSINLAQGGEHTFVYDFNDLPGNINIYVCGDVNVGNLNATFAGTTNPPAVDACRIYFETAGVGSNPAGNAFIIGAGSHFFGIVYAPYGGIQVGSGGCCTFVTGHLWSAFFVNIQHGVTVIPCECINSITICKVFLNDDPLHDPADDWTFTIVPGVDGVSASTTFTIDKAGGCRTFSNLDPTVTYTVTETLQVDPSCPAELPVADRYYVVANTCGTGNVGTFTVGECGNATCTFTNSPPDCRPDECQWCTNKCTELNQCAVPDILVDVRLPHGGANDFVTADEIGTGVPATWSIQAAINYVNTNGDPTPGDGQIFIGVIATDPIPVDPTDNLSCGKSCARPPSNDLVWGTENVIVTNANTETLNIFGCSVTMRPENVNLPVFTIQNSVGKVTIIGLNVWNSNAAGYLVKGGANGNSELVLLKSSSAYYNTIGYNIQDDKVEVTGVPHVYGNGIGLLVAGTNIKLRTNSDIVFNTIAGIKITGSGNETNNNEVGKSGRPNATGIWVTGNNNNLHDDDVFFNTGNGIYVTGDNNLIKQEDAISNGQYGILAQGTGNKLDGNRADKNGKQGIRACGQVDIGGNTGVDNAEDPQVSFVCPDPATAKFSVVDLSTDKSYKYNATFNLISSSLQTANNSDGNDAVTNGSNRYVLDKNDKQVYRYGTSGVSKVLKSSAGGSLSSPSGIALDGDELWVVDGSTKIIYRYSVATAFAAAGTVNALQQIVLTGNNGNAEGLAIDATYLYVLDNNDKQFYRYLRAGGAGTASKVLKDPLGSSLGNPTGAVLDVADMWIVDNNKDKAYRYVFANLGFGVAGTINASSQYPLFSLNANATGIAVGTSANLQRSVIPSNEIFTVTEDMPIQVYPNPAHNNVRVEFRNAKVGKYKMNLVDMTGRIMMSYKDATTDGITVHEFDVSKLARGSYIIVLEKQNMKKELKKIVIQ